MNFASSPKSDPIADTAAAWLARRDRGFTASEQDEYLQWLRQDPRHGPAVARLENSWAALDALARWRPEHSVQPNPDLLAAPPRKKIYWLSTAALALVASLVLAAVMWWPRQSVSSTISDYHRIITAQSFTRQALSDGSIVELQAGAQLEVAFRPAVRNVRLVVGEGHFMVAKNQERPFVVHAGRIAVHAVGTAFSVRLQPDQVEVSVTEGKVHVDEPAAPEHEVLKQPLLVAGERAVISTDQPIPRAVVASVDGSRHDPALSEISPRFEFVDQPLSAVVAEFNRHNSRRLVLGDPFLADLRIGGTLRLDDADAFVRLLESSFSIRAERRGDETILYRRP